MVLPKYHTATATIGAGRSTHSVSEGEIVTITRMAIIMVTRVVALYMMPGPSTMRTELRSLVARDMRSEEHTSELQSRGHLVCRLLLEKKNKKTTAVNTPATTIRQADKRVSS